MAISVEFLGDVEENQGWMYFIRDNYSVIITDGGIGFGYVFVANQFINAMNVPQEEWYGTRAIFSACKDVPDKDSCTSGVRWKGLRVSIMPEHSKGPYRYPGIWRPPPISFLEGPVAAASVGKKFEEGESEGELELPEEALQEINIMGKDVIGMSRLNDATKAKPVLKPTTENLLNEREEIPQELLFPPLVEESSEVVITMVEQPVTSTNTPPPPAPAPPVVNNNNVDVDLLGLNDVSNVVNVNNGPSSLTPQSLSKPSDDLIGLFEGLRSNLF